MTSRLLLALAALGLAACGESAGTPTIGLSVPSAVAVFDGVTAKNPGAVHPYVAVANSGRDELVLVDAVDDAPVLAPVLIRTLAIPVPDPRPALVVAGDLGDDADAGARSADLLVAMSAGSSLLELVQTWAVAGIATPRVLPEHAIELGEPAVAIAAVPVPDAASPSGRQSGRVRIVAAVGDGRLAVVDYVRQPDGGIVPAQAEPVFQQLPFQPVSLATDPADPTRLYAATPDRIPATVDGVEVEVEGVAELDVRGAPGAWTWRALDARAPTRLVAAFTLRERLPGSAADGIEAFQEQAEPRVYALLDSTRCGPEHRTSCGIAVLDPVAGGPIADPSGQMPYLAPIAVPSTPVAMSIAGPPAVRPPEDPAVVQHPELMKIAPGTGVRGTTAVMALPSVDGLVYFVDLGRWAIPNDTSLLRGTTRTAATGATVTAETRTDDLPPQRLGLWDRTVNPPVLQFAGSALVNGTDPSQPDRPVRVTPGFTVTDTWTVTQEGVLPGLAVRAAQTGPHGDGRPWLALQVPVADDAGGVRLTRVGRLYDPALGVHPGDLVTLDTRAVPGCPTAVGIEARIGELVAPDAARPGGAVVLDAPACVPAAPGGEPGCAAAEAQACAAALASEAPGRAPILVTFRGADLVVASAVHGYAGRAPLAENATSPGYVLEYAAVLAGTTEEALAAACPLVPWPFPEPFAGSVPACDEACRAGCERLLLARKARRVYHLSDACGAVSDPTVQQQCFSTWPPERYPFPDAPGPVIAFSVGKELPDRDIPRDLSVTITTRGGIAPASRQPPLASGGVATMPLGAATFDRSPYRPADGYRFYVPYVAGQVLDFSPGLAPNTAGVIR